MNIDCKRIYSIILRIFCLFFLGGLAILMYHHEFKLSFNRDTPEPSVGGQKCFLTMIF